MTPEQQKVFDAAFDALQAAHDEMKLAIKDVASFSRSGDIGWNQGCELSAHAGSLSDRWEDMKNALTVLYPLRTQD